MIFRARYSGQCAYGDLIEPGDYCTYNDDGDLVHTECDQPDWDADIHSDPVCPTCQLEHRGECF